MRDTTALSTPFVISSLHTTRPAMSEARRQHIYGKIQSLQEEGRAIGEPSLRVGVGLLGLIAVLVTLAATLIP